MTLARAIETGEQVLSHLGEWSLLHGGLGHLGMDTISADSALAVGFSEETPHGRRMRARRRAELHEQLYGATK